MSDADLLAQIRDLEARRHQAMRDADLATLEALLSDRLVYTHSNATTDSKASYIAKVASKYFDYLELDHNEDILFQAGDVVFVVGRMFGRVRVDQSHERKLDNKTLVAWTREDGAWKCLVFHPTPIPAPAP